jgi:peptidoglycan hydrolase-like protein with peptidoglycan-binding domain
MMRSFLYPFIVAAVAVVFLLDTANAYALTRVITFPVSGAVTFRDDFGEPRGGGTRTHMGVDIIAPKMTPELAAVDGTIAFIAIPEASWGYSITIRDSEGYSYRYIHMNNDTPGTDDGNGGPEHAYAPGITRGAHVTKGQLVGWVGDSGDAEDTVSHLHFEISTPDRTTIDPYDSLKASYTGLVTGGSTVISDSGNEGSISAEEQFIAVRTLQEGMTDTDVTVLEQELKTMGIYIGPISETYSSATREAVRKFQNMYKLEPTGMADPLTRKTLAAAALLVPAPAPVTTVSAGLEEGAQGEAVRQLQLTLINLGYLHSTATGFFGPLTKTAVTEFQKANGIDAIGVVGPKTAAALKNATPGSNPGTPAETGTTGAHMFTKNFDVGARGADVTALQIILKTQGYFRVDVSGYFGPLTRTAVMDFQKANGIEPVGTVGPKTRAVLNAI